MTSTVVKCPGCDVRMRIPEGAAGRALRCSKCKQVFRVPAAAVANTAAPEQSSVFSGLNTPELAAGAQFEQPLPRSDVRSAGRVAPPGLRANESTDTKPAPDSGNLLQRCLREAERKRATNPSLRPYLRRLGVGLIALSVLLAILFAIGLAFEPVAMAAVGIGMAAMLGLLIAARLWLWIVTFREGRAVGWLCTLIPVFEILYINARRGPMLKPAALFASAVVPMLLSLGMLLVYQPLYSGSGRTASRAAQVDRIEKLIHETEQRMAANAPGHDGPLEPQVVNLRILNPHQADHESASKADVALRRFKHYVPGSFSLSEDRRLATFSHHGDSNLAQQYQLLARSVTGLVWVPE